MENERRIITPDSTYKRLGTCMYEELEYWNFSFKDHRTIITQLTVEGLMQFSNICLITLLDSIFLTRLINSALAGVEIEEQKTLNRRCLESTKSTNNKSTVYTQAKKKKKKNSEYSTKYLPTFTKSNFSHYSAAFSLSLHNSQNTSTNRTPILCDYTS